MEGRVRAEWISHASGLRSRFVDEAPFPHVVLDDFLEPSFLARLMAQFPAFETGRAINEFGEPGGKAFHPNLRDLGDAYAELDDLLRSAQFLKWLGAVTGIDGLLYDPDYVGGGTHENLDGQELDPHVDFNYHPLTHLHRRLNLLVYLNPEWDAAWGGSLELHRDPWASADIDEVAAIAPACNRCVIFATTEISWHGFARIELPADKKHLSRRSVAVYFYTKTRPAAESASEHGTIYAPRQLPAYFREGYRLTRSDVARLQILLERRDQQIRSLYEREQEFSRIAGSLSYRVTAALLRRFRWLRRLNRRIE